MSDSNPTSYYFSLCDDDSMSYGDMTPVFGPQMPVVELYNSLEDEICIGIKHSSTPVFGPQMPVVELYNSLEKEIRICINLDGCKGLPPIKSSGNGNHHRRSWYLRFRYISSRDSNASTDSSTAYEGKGIHRGTVQWNETLYIDCFERSPIFIELNESEFFFGSGACVSVEDFITRSEVTPLPDSGRPGDIFPTLVFSASRVLDNCDEKTRRSDPTEDVQSDDLCIDLNFPSSLWDTVLCQFQPFTETLCLVRSEINIEMTELYWVQMYTFIALQKCRRTKSHDLDIDQLLTTMAKTMDVVGQSSGALVRHGSVVKDIVDQLYWLTRLMDDLMDDLSDRKEGGYHEYREAELARLVIIIGTPDPTTGARSTSAVANQHTILGTIAKDALICALDALAQSSDACSPLKSVAGGLMFFATWADLVSSNKADIREICERISSLVKYFKFAVTDGDPLTSAHQNTINALAEDITNLNSAVEEVVTERKSRLRRYVSAKQHRKKLEGVARKLDEARGNYTAAVVTLNATTIANVQAHVQAYTVLMGTTPMYAPGTCRADASTFPYNAARIEDA